MASLRSSPSAGMRPASDSRHRDSSPCSMIRIYFDVLQLMHDYVVLLPSSVSTQSPLKSTCCSAVGRHPAADCTSRCTATGLHVIQPTLPCLSSCIHKCAGLLLLQYIYISATAVTSQGHNSGQQRVTLAGTHSQRSRRRALMMGSESPGNCAARSFTPGAESTGHRQKHHWATHQSQS